MSDKRELRCPCGGAVEERGDVRYYGPGTAYVSVDGAREFVEETWRTPIETLTMDDPPLHCLDCDAQMELSDLVVIGITACGCLKGTHDDSISAISRFHAGVNPWPIRTALQRESLALARQAQESPSDAFSGPLTAREGQ